MGWKNGTGDVTPIIAGDGINKIGNTVSVDFNEVAQKEHSHVASDITNISYNDLLDKPESLPANGGNSDTVDNKHVNDLIFDRLRQQLVCNELSRIVTDPANIRALMFFDENGDIKTLKDRANSNRQAYLSANASSLSPDIVGNARVLNFSNNATWELDPWVEYNASSGNLPDSALERYPWVFTFSGTITRTVSGGTLNITAAGDSNAVNYTRLNGNKIVEPSKTKSIEIKAKYNGGGDSALTSIVITDGVKMAWVRIRKDGTLTYYGSGGSVNITTGLNVTSDFVLKATVNSADGLKVYFNGVQQGSTVSYSNLYTNTGNYVQFTAQSNTDAALDVSIYYVNYMLDVSKSLSFTDGAGNDLPFSLVWCGSPNASINQKFISKEALTTGLERSEYGLYSDNNGWLAFVLRSEDSTEILGRHNKISISSDVGKYKTYIGTYNGSKTTTGLKVYNDGTRVDDTNWSTSTYTGMTATNTKVCNYRLNTAGNLDMFGNYKGSVIAIIAEELTADQCKQIDAVLRSYCGFDAVTV